MRSALPFVLLLSGFAATPSPPAFEQNLDRFLAETMSTHQIPGLAVALTRGREIVYLRALGVANLETGEPLVPESLFHMASVSKPFVATAIVQLVEEGKIDLDAPVTRYLPYFQLADERYREITIRQMLNHTSGMPDVEDYEWDKAQYDEGAAERFVRGLSGETMIGAPGERWRYSNMAFDTLGDVIAKVSGQSFEEYEKTRILGPLGMKESTFIYPDTRPELRTTGHVWDLEPKVSAVYPYNRRHAPSSTLNSSVVEMARWAFANLNRGELEGVRILGEKSYDLLWRPSASMDENVGVGLSWFLEERRGTRVVSHSGGDTGFSSHCALVPDKDVAVILASNYDRTPMRGIRDGVIDIVLGHEAVLPRPSVANTFARTLVGQGIEAATTQYRELASSASDRSTIGQLVDDARTGIEGDNPAPEDGSRRTLSLLLRLLEDLGFEGGIFVDGFDHLRRIRLLGVIFGPSPSLLPVSLGVFAPLHSHQRTADRRGAAGSGHAADFEFHLLGFLGHGH